ncbi:Variant-specific surface protein, partial [Giardia duodenalis]
VLYGLPAMFEKITFGIAILQVVWAAQTCTEATSDSQSGKCKQNMCNVWIGGSNFCSQCSTAAEHLVNGKCITTGEDAEGACTAKNDGTCTSCKAGFFLHRGGCYEIGTEPGNLICEDTQASQTQGVCEACSSGYFKNPTESLDKTKESCIACNQTTAIDGSTGVASCKVCGPLAAPGTVTCILCEDGKFGEACATDCNAECKGCSAGTANDCTSCNGGKYLKVANEQATSGQCVEKATCTSTHFPVTADERCYPCNTVNKGGVDGCTTCSKPEDAVTCTACAEGKKPNSAGTRCVSCPTKDCAKCNDDGICAECGSGKKLTPTKECTQSCGAIGSYYDGDKECEPCDPSCAACTTEGPAKCTLCPPGKMLKYTNDDPSQGGSCVDECKAEMDGCAECGAIIGGTKYCSKCKEDKWAPQNGVCANSVTRSSFCTNAAGGVCTQCAADHFLQDGGCYKLGRQPGEQICTTASSAGKCETCTNSLRPNDGACPSCHSTCKTCSTADSSDKCTSCAAGYYMVGSAAGPCTSCDSNSGSVKGVAGCLNCAPPSSGSGSVLCYLMKDADSTGGSTNRSGLSTGAIAGIAMAAVIVVGGLVGFLCWWFLCRGKA